ncbi:MAG TPA: sigma-70 family RNA polymerase sigma factor [Bacteroidales bacterium]|nr:sigma-70 family RNA polymerase sigma factor [Bacteroidales bacterium]HSA43180.1 sigma-70 family RNA polymerase sigma factor [Bacteroidales bacterium]
MTDEELIKKLLANERDAFRELVNLYQDRVVRTAAGLLPTYQDAEDIAQEVFVEIYRSLHAFRHDARLSTWIYRITVNKAINLQKRNKRKQWITSLESWFHSAGNDDGGRDSDRSYQADHPIQNAETARVLDQALNALPDKQRIAFTLHKVEGLPHREIADIMQVSIPSVESLIFRARVNLQKSLAGYYKLY